MVEGIQYREGLLSARWRIFSTDVLHHQYVGGPSLVLWRVCSMDLSHHQYGGECVQYRTTKTAQGVVGGYIYLGKLYFTDHLAITQISSDCC